MNESESLAVAEAAAVLAGDFLKSNQVDAGSVVADAGRDIKLKEDLASESLILEFLKENSDFSILSEERGKVGGASGDYNWIVDPLDGSFNYFRGIQFCCVSIALFKNNRPVLGVINCFQQAEIFKGIVGTGAWMNESPISVSTENDIASSVLATGLPINLDFSDSALKNYARSFKDYKKVRMMGSAACSLAYVAAGRLDIYHEKAISIWDVAAGIALVEAAGGSIRISGYPETNQPDVWAASSETLMGH